MDELTYPYPIAGLRDPADRLAGLVEADARGQRPHLQLFYGHHGRPGTVGPWVYSQWWDVEFRADGLVYPNAEAFMMYAKARLFGDDAAMVEMQKTRDPHRLKRLGRTVRGFDQAVWDAHAYRFVVAGNLAKFGQHRDLAAYLARSAPAVLVEASPSDRIWGIGRDRSDPRAQRPGQWAGTNLLGFALTEVRERLTAGATSGGVDGSGR